jgi:hypothetical protein
MAHEPSADEVRTRIRAAYGALLQRYASWGGHSFPGWDFEGASDNYLGPTVWSEGDCAFRFALELEPLFPEMVHLEFPLARWTLPTAVSQRLAPTGRLAPRYVDIAISDHRGFPLEGDRDRAFKEWPHLAFIEVKQMKRQAHGPFRFDLHKRVASANQDAKRLRDMQEPHHHGGQPLCKVAGILIFDDGDYLLDERCPKLSIPEEVEALIVSPSALRDADIAESR